MAGLFYGLFAGLILLNSCNNSDAKTQTKPVTANVAASPENKTGKKHFAGAFSNGMKGDSISFDISEDGRKLENLTFKGYWRCAGRLESTTVGPDGAFNITDNKVNDHISEPPDGGSTAWRFDLVAAIDASTASGTFRMNINNLGCDTYKLNWTAVMVPGK